MQVIIRGQKVKSELIAKSLAYIEKDFYKPNFLVCFHQRSSFLFFLFYLSLFGFKYVSDLV